MNREKPSSRGRKDAQVEIEDKLKRKSIFSAEDEESSFKEFQEQNPEIDREEFHELLLKSNRMKMRQLAVTCTKEMELLQKKQAERQDLIDSKEFYILKKRGAEYHELEKEGSYAMVADIEEARRLLQAAQLSKETYTQKIADLARLHELQRSLSVWDYVTGKRKKKEEEMDKIAKSLREFDYEKSEWVLPTVDDLQKEIEQLDIAIIKHEAGVREAEDVQEHYPLIKRLQELNQEIRIATDEFLKDASIFLPAENFIRRLEDGMKIRKVTMEEYAPNDFWSVQTLVKNAIKRDVEAISREMAITLGLVSQGKISQEEYAVRVQQIKRGEVAPVQ